ncbi:MAG: tetratricopeptide repeat protein [Deltaproteobacteria bacterium]|nr:tetratricopeptide repeat protein [Deltaproteobacteria bacterium]
MPEISNKKRKFIKRNYKQLSIEELARQTGLTPHVIRSLIDEYSTEIPGKDQSTQTQNRALTFLSWKIILLTALLFAAVIIIIYSPSLQSPFVFDDMRNIQDNPRIHTTRVSQLTELLFSKEISRRIGLMSFALNYYFGGLNTFGYHLVNVIIHILNGLTLFILSYTILTLPSNEGKERENALRIAFLGSLLWLVHPIQTQAVSYIVQRLTSLAALFFLLSLLCYMKGRVNQAKKRMALFMLSILFGLLAVGTKQNAATLPFFIILSELLFFHPQPFKIKRKKFIFLMTLVGLFILVAVVYLGPDFITKWTLSYERRGWTPLERVLTQPRVVIFYLSLLIFPYPSRLNLDHDFPLSHSLFTPFTTFLSLVVIISFLAFAIFLIKRNRLISYAIFWFFGNLVIESSIIPLELIFEHRLYLPSMALIIVVLGLCFSLSKREWGKWVTGLIILLTLLFSYWTYERSSVWRGPLSLWEDAAQKSPHIARPHYNLGNAYKNSDRLDEAIAEYKRALAINPNYLDALYNLGNTYLKKGKLDKAIDMYKKALAISPNFSRAHRNLGSAYLKKGENKLAITHFNMVKEIDAKSTSPADINLSGIIKPKAGKTVSELYAQKDDLKFSKNIMGKNWIHLRDGTGGNGTNDLTITTSAKATLGDIVVVSGIVVANKDFGYGYKYDIIIEDAIVTVE